MRRLLSMLSRIDPTRRRRNDAFAVQRMAEAVEPVQAAFRRITVDDSHPHRFLPRQGASSNPSQQ
jgi:hypothetical protein